MRILGDPKPIKVRKKSDNARHRISVPFGVDDSKGARKITALDDEINGYMVSLTGHGKNDVVVLSASATVVLTTRACTS